MKRVRIPPGVRVDLPDIHPPRCEGGHAFEKICNDCDHAQPDGPCSVCPHLGPPEVCAAEHNARNPCGKCKSTNLRTIRVKAPIGMEVEEC